MRHSRGSQVIGAGQAGHESVVRDFHIHLNVVRQTDIVERIVDNVRDAVRSDPLDDFRFLKFRQYHRHAVLPLRRRIAGCGA